MSMTGKDRWSITEQDILALEIGAGILGTGGGGNPYLVKLRALEVLRAGHKMEILPLESLPDDAKVVPLGGIGAPVVGVERIKEGAEGVRALRALEDRLGFKADALACQEIGGANSMEPLIIAAQAGIPVVDCDGMGRAFPEMQMTAYSIYGHQSTPSAMADPHGNIVIFDHAVTEIFHERMARAVVVSQGGSSTLALAPMTGAFTKKAAIPGSYSKAIALGRTVLEARAERLDPIAAICAAEGGHVAFKGKITDVKREIAGGFVRGDITIDGFGDWTGQSGAIELQNEFLIFRRDGTTEIVVPDLIVVLDDDDGTPLSTDMLRYGQRIAVLALPAHPLLRTPQALEVIGPKAFGYDDLTYS
ncbi:DUF917 domain-containing protein [Roseibium marinum]|uniref:DUF917 domain-containing protein n=1 Tax=Roseibium marinum TaxID=281252 RepID=A0A2S3UN37_9HYPH|nr:DUF917 domain-containing protein [Roseibium marinum]POF29106.1 hypothetical protein CLV41_110110 [Roseibium marinum]